MRIGSDMAGGVGGEIGKALLVALVIGALAGVLLGVGFNRKPEQQAAYSRGYAAAVDSVRDSRWRVLDGNVYASADTAAAESVLVFRVDSGRGFLVKLSGSTWAVVRSIQ